MKIKAYLIDVINETHKALQCTVIDIQERKIGKKVFDIICDDEGLFKQPAKISAIDNLGSPMFVGNLLVVKNKDGETTTLSDEDVYYVSEHVEKLCTKLFPKLNMKLNIGDKIEIIEMVGEPQYTGKVGVVDYIDSKGQVFGSWGGLAVQPEHDKVRLLEG